MITETLVSYKFELNTKLSQSATELVGETTQIYDLFRITRRRPFKSKTRWKPKVTRTRIGAYTRGERDCLIWLKEAVDQRRAEMVAEVPADDLFSEVGVRSLMMNRDSTE